MPEKIRLGISTCLLGEPVRYDGGHKLDRWLRDTLGRYVEYVPVCPEVECGFGVPRETFRLEGDPDAPRLVTTRGKVDYTERMLKWAKKRAAGLAKENLCGFIFKAKSPSSGMERVKVYNAKGVPVKKGVGIFARAFQEAFPHLPVEDEGRLHDAGLRENFIERIFTLTRWREASEPRLLRGDLVRFHMQHKLLILSHSPKIASEMGRLVARAKTMAPTALREEYEIQLMAALRFKATVKKNTNVLQHVMGYFRQDLTADEKAELVEVIESYRKELVPLIVPITLLNHYVRKYDQPYLTEQVYLHPHPIELQLRNHC